MSAGDACKHIQEYGEGVEFPIAASLEHFDECFTPEHRLEAHLWLRERSEVGMRCLMAGHAEQRALAETTYRLGYELGRKEALTETAAIIRKGMHAKCASGNYAVCEVCHALRELARIVEAHATGERCDCIIGPDHTQADHFSLVSQPSGAASTGLTGTGGHSDLPEGGEGL